MGLARLHICAGWPEPLLVAFGIIVIFIKAGSFVVIVSVELISTFTNCAFRIWTKKIVQYLSLFDLIVIVMCLFLFAMMHVSYQK